MNMRSIACGLAVIGFGAASYPAAAQTFAAKPGAWEMTITTTGNPVPPDVLAKMSAERRAEVEKRVAEGGRPQTRKTCVKAEDLQEDRFMRSQDPNCTVKTVSRSATRLAMATTCTGPAPSTGTMSFEAKTPESVTGSIDQERAAGGKFHIGIAGRWLGATCDGLDGTSAGAASAPPKK